MPAPLVLDIVGTALRNAGFHSMADLEFSVFGRSWIGDKLGVSGGERYYVQDRYVDHQERLESLCPMHRAVVRELFNLREPGIKLCLVLMGFLGKEHLPQGRGKKAAREDLEKLMQRAVDPYIPAPKEEEYPFKYPTPPPCPAKGFRKNAL